MLSNFDSVRFMWILSMGIDTLRVCSSNHDIFDKLNLDAFKTSRGQASQEKLLVEDSRVSIHELHLRKYSQSDRCEGAYLKVSPIEVVMEFSAKALGDSYLEGISENTFEKLIHNLNKTGEGYYQLNANKVYDNFHAQRIHNTFNFELPHGAAVKTIQAIQSNWNWSHKKADNRFLTTANFGNQSEKLSIYEKRCQLTDSNSPFLIYLKPKIDYSRVEHKLENKKQLTKVYNTVLRNGTNLISLEEVLKEKNSKKILLHTLNQIKLKEMKPNQDILFRTEIFNQISNPQIKIHTIKENAGYGGLFELLGANESILESALSIRFHGKPSSHKSRLKKQFLTGYDIYMKMKSSDNFESYRTIAENFLSDLKEAIAM